MKLFALLVNNLETLIIILMKLVAASKFIYIRGIALNHSSICTRLTFILQTHNVWGLAVIKDEEHPAGDEDHLRIADTVYVGFFSLTTLPQLVPFLCYHFFKASPSYLNLMISYL